MLEEKFFGAYSAAAGGRDPWRTVGQSSEQENGVRRVVLEPRIDRWGNLACCVGGLARRYPGLG
jgi:hypothetical protein